jgi:hypothetical protein
MWTMKLRTADFHELSCWLLQKVAIHDGRAATAIFMVLFWSAIFEFPNSLLLFRSLIALGSHKPHNFWWISATVRFFTFKDRITARFSQLARFSIKLFLLKRCNTTQKRSLQNLFIFLIPFTTPAESFHFPYPLYHPCRIFLFSLSPLPSLQNSSSLRTFPFSAGSAWSH